MILAAIPLVIPTQGFYTHELKLFMAITIFCLALAAFELVNMMFIAIVMPSLWIFLNIAPAETVMAPYASTTLLMLTGAMFLGATITSCVLKARKS